MAFYSQIIIRRRQRNRLPSHRFTTWLRPKSNNVVPNGRSRASLHPKASWECHNDFLEEPGLLLGGATNLPVALFPGFPPKALREPRCRVRPSQRGRQLRSFGFNFLCQLRKHIGLQILFPFSLVVVPGGFSRNLNVETSRQSRLTTGVHWVGLRTQLRTVGLRLAHPDTFARLL